MQIGDRVRYTHVNSELEASLGYYPPTGTLGTIVKVDEDGIMVKWDSGTKGNGEWYCDFEDVVEVDDESSPDILPSEMDVSYLYL